MTRGAKAFRSPAHIEKKAAEYGAPIWRSACTRHQPDGTWCRVAKRLSDGLLDGHVDGREPLKAVGTSAVDDAEVLFCK